MSDVLPIFDEPDIQPPKPATTHPMTSAQREGLRNAFALLGLTSAKSQFTLIEELTGRTITSVQDVTAQQAAALLPLLTSRVNSRGRQNTGNAWNDRTEDTWIDKL